MIPESLKQCGFCANIWMIPECVNCFEQNNFVLKKEIEAYAQQQYEQGERDGVENYLKGLSR